MFEQGTGVTFLIMEVSFDGSSELTQEFSIGQAVEQVTMFNLIL